LNVELLKCDKENCILLLSPGQPTKAGTKSVKEISHSSVLVCQFLINPLSLNALIHLLWPAAAFVCFSFSCLCQIPLFKASLAWLLV